LSYIHIVSILVYAKLVKENVGYKEVGEPEEIEDVSCTK